MYGLAQNLSFVLRQLRQALGFTLTVVLTLALGIGATTAMFSLVEGVLLRPLPFKDADRLVLLGEHLGGRPGMSVRAREIATYSNATQVFSSRGGYITASFELSGGRAWIGHGSDEMAKLYTHFIRNTESGFSIMIPAAG